MPEREHAGLTLVLTEGTSWLVFHFEGRPSVAVGLRPDDRARQVDLAELMISWSQTARVVHDELWVFDVNGLPRGWMLRVDLQSGELDAEPLGGAMEDHASTSYPVETPKGLWLTARRADEVHILLNAQTGETPPKPFGESCPHHALVHEAWMLDGRRHIDMPLGRQLEDDRLFFDLEHCEDHRWPQGQPFCVAGPLWMVDQEH